jgi:hypothetical protein
MATVGGWKKTKFQKALRSRANNLGIEHWATIVAEISKQRRTKRP